VNPIDTIANAAMISLVALSIENNPSFTNDHDFVPTLLKVSRMSRDFIELLASRMGKQSADIFPNNENELKEWPKQLLQIVKEKGLDKDQEVLLAAQEILPYENRLMETIEKHVSHNQQSYSGQITLLAGDSSTDAPPPPKKK
jgi:hypothetical protein